MTPELEEKKQRKNNPAKVVNAPKGQNSRSWIENPTVKIKTLLFDKSRALTLGRNPEVAQRAPC